MTSPVAWRDHYTQLCAEGEAQGLKFSALADYISQRLAGDEYRAMIEEWGPILDRNRQHATNPPPTEATP